MPQHENAVEQATRPQADAVVLQVPINPSDNNVVTIATGNSFQQVVGSNSSATERQALIIKNDNTNGDTCWVFFGGDKASKEESVILDSGGSYVRYWPFVSRRQCKQPAPLPRTRSMSRSNKRDRRINRVRLKSSEAI
jgi:hypothetical protein